jgi:outer membrane protein W
MNRSRIVILFAVLLIGLSVAANSYAEGRTGGYILIKPGAFIPTNDLDHKGFDKTFSGEVTVGTYYTPNLALEAGVGYFRTEASRSGSDFAEDDAIWVLPVTVTFKGVIPFRGGEVNAGVGPGLYFANLEADGTNTASGHYSNDSHSTAVEGHAVVGLNFDITKQIFLGAEGKYSVTTGAHMLGTKIKLDGFTATGVLGFRL